LLVQFDIVRQEARTLLAQPSDLGRNGVAPRRGFAELLLQAAHPNPFAAMPLLRARQLRTRGGMVFPNRCRLPFQFLQLLRSVSSHRVP
jgi:hypothetical protein